MKLSDIKVNPTNPRLIKDDKFKKLVVSIKDFPAMMALRPIVVDEHMTILGGNMRYRALREAGYLEIPDNWVKIADQLTKKEKERFIIEDNMPFGEWDFEILANNFEIKDLLEWGFDEHDLKIEATTEDEPPEVSDEPAVSKLGEVYKLGNHRLMCGDATKIEDVSKLMDGKKGQMVFTDPPYNVDYTGGMSGDNFKSKRSGILNDKMSTEKFYQFLYDSMSNLISVVDGAFYVCMSSSELHNLWKAFTSAGGHWQTYIIWAKDSFTLSRSDYQHQFEPIMHGLTDSAVQKAINEVDEDKLPIMYGWTKHEWYGGRKQGDVWRFDRPKVSKEHPTMKPIALGGRAIMNSTNRGDIVVDTFAGSGSTLIACEQLERKCYAMELDPKYCDVIRKRYAKFIGKEDEWQKITQ